MIVTSKEKSRRTGRERERKSESDHIVLFSKIP